MHILGHSSHSHSYSPHGSSLAEPSSCHKPIESHDSPSDANGCRPEDTGLDGTEQCCPQSVDETSEDNQSLDDSGSETTAFDPNFIEWLLHQYRLYTQETGRTSSGSKGGAGSINGMGGGANGCGGVHSGNDFGFPAAEHSQGGLPPQSEDIGMGHQLGFSGAEYVPTQNWSVDEGLDFNEDPLPFHMKSQGNPAPAGQGAPGAPAAPAAPPAPTPQQAAPVQGAAPAQGATPVAPTAGKGALGGFSGEAQTVANTPQQTAEISAQYMANLQKDFGLTKEQAAGIVGNLSHESAGMNSGINQGGAIGAPSGNMADDNGNGYGIAQWGGVRKEGLIRFARENGVDPSSHAANYGFLKQELQGEYASSITAVKGANDVAGATQAFCSTYEKPSDPQMGSRVQIAQSLVA